MSTEHDVTPEMVEDYQRLTQPGYGGGLNPCYGDHYTLASCTRKWGLGWQDKVVAYLKAAAAFAPPIRKPEQKPQTEVAARPTNDLPYLQAKAWVLSAQAERLSAQAVALANESANLKMHATALARDLERLLQKEQTL